MFYLSERQGRNWIAIAGTECEAASCLAAAETVFQECGIPTADREILSDNQRAQKNFKGLAKGFKVVSCSPRARSARWFAEALRMPCYGGKFDNLLRTFPEAKELREEIEKRL